MSDTIQPMRVGIYYDGNYLLYLSNYYNYFHPIQCRPNIQALQRWLQALVAEQEHVPLYTVQIARADFFRGRLSAQEAQHRGNQLYNDRVFDDVLMAAGIHTHYLPLPERSGRREGKGVGIWLALEALDAAISVPLDVVVLISADGNFTPLVRKLTERGVRVLAFRWECDYYDTAGTLVSTRSSQQLLDAASYAIDAYQLIEDGLHEQTPNILAMFDHRPEKALLPESQDAQQEDEDSDNADLANAHNPASPEDGLLAPNEQNNSDGYSSTSTAHYTDHDPSYRYPLSPFPYQHRRPASNYARPGLAPYAKENMPLAPERYQGEVLSVHHDRGFGFIRKEPNNLFFFYKEVRDEGFASLAPGDTVEYSIGVGPNDRIVAKDVVIIQQLIQEIPMDHDPNLDF